MNRILTIALSIVLLNGIARAQNGSRIDWPRYQDMAVELMQQYLRINTSNPPGNEIEAARFFKKIFDQHGIENEIFEYKPGRANIIARLKGNGSKRPIILLSVIADPSIKIENINRFKPPNSSPINTELFSLIARKTKEKHPGAVITTKMLSGYTESQLYRQLGITAYGWAPIYTTPEEDEGVHGNNERISVRNVREGTREFYEVVKEISR